MKHLPTYSLRALSLIPFLAFCLFSQLKADIIFDSEFAYTNNFTTVYNGGPNPGVYPDGSNPQMDPTNSYLFQRSPTGDDTQTGIGVYKGDTLFQTETISMDFHLNSIPSNHSMGIYLRVNEGTGMGVLALFNISTGGNLRLRLFYDSVLSSGAVGTQFQRVDVSGALTAETNYTFQVTQGIDGDSGNSVFRASVLDEGGSIIATTIQELDATDAYDAAGGIALRMYSGTNIEYFNFKGENVTPVIPEASSTAWLFGGVAIVLALFGTKRRRARQ